MPTISDDLHGLDYSDTHTKAIAPNTYDYTLTASDGGKVSFKVKAFVPAMIGEAPSAAHWITIEEKSKVPSGTSLSGSFTVPQTRLSSTVTADTTQVEFHFTREFASDGVNYVLTWKVAT